MKKSLFALAALATVFAFSCTKEEQIPEEINNAQTGIVLTVSAEQNLTKGSYSTEGQFTWAEGDIIGVDMWDSTHNWPAQLTLKEGAGQPVAKFQTSDTYDFGNVAFYPWNGWNDQGADLNGTNMGGDGKFYVHLKPEIDYNNAAGNPQQLLPVAANISNGQTEDILFKHLGAGIKVTLKNVPASANKITLTVPGKNITGWYTVDDISTIGTTSIVSTDGDNSTVTMNFPAASADRAEMDFVFPVPTGEIPGMVVALYDGTTELFKRNAPAQPTLSRGEVLTNSPLTVDSYFLCGWINGANYACEGDAANFGQYRFVNGKLRVAFTSDSYVFIKDAHGNYYMKESWDESATSATLKNTSTGWNEKLKVPANTAVEFTLTKSGDEITLSYSAIDNNVTLYFGINLTDETGLKFCSEALGTAAWPGSDMDLTDYEILAGKKYYKYTTQASNVWGKTPTVLIYGVSPSGDWDTYGQPLTADFTKPKNAYYFEVVRGSSFIQLSERPLSPEIHIDGTFDEWDPYPGMTQSDVLFKATADKTSLYVYMRYNTANVTLSGWGTYMRLYFDVDGDTTNGWGEWYRTGTDHLLLYFLCKTDGELYSASLENHQAYGGAETSFTSSDGVAVSGVKDDTYIQYEFKVNLATLDIANDSTVRISFLGYLPGETSSLGNFYLLNIPKAD